MSPTSQELQHTSVLATVTSQFKTPSSSSLFSAGSLDKLSPTTTTSDIEPLRTSASGSSQNGDPPLQGRGGYNKSQGTRIGVLTLSDFATESATGTSSGVEQDAELPKLYVDTVGSRGYTSGEYQGADTMSLEF